MNVNDSNHELITTALLLAAGTGSRLDPLTQNMPKCLTMVNETSILERLVICLKKQGFKRLVVVTGYLENCIREFLETRAGGMTIDYIFSPLYKTTNNIYSLWMAREIINEPFLLVESDLVFDESLLDDMRYPDRIAIACMQAWMNGSTVTVNHSQQVKRFQIGITGPLDDIIYKTVNIYSLSLPSWHAIVERLDQYISDGRVNCYYETVFAEMVADGSLCLQPISFDAKPWYEIDTIADLAEAKRLFPADKHETIIPYSETVTRSLSGLRASPKSNSLFMKPIHDPNIKEDKVSPKEKSKRSGHVAL
ncbi:MAG: phosphocholine cytidylyltransferase family protein [bacterium]|nr:phosphocholine cytidylyltransferase family protein [bacterium]